MFLLSASFSDSGAQTSLQQRCRREMEHEVRVFDVRVKWMVKLYQQHVYVTV